MHRQPLRWTGSKKMATMQPDHQAQNDIQTVARLRYGPDLSIAQYVAHLAEDMGMSESGVKKLWYGQRGQTELSPAVRRRLQVLLGGTGTP